MVARKLYWLFNCVYQKVAYARILNYLKVEKMLFLNRSYRRTDYLLLVC